MNEDLGAFGRSIFCFFIEIRDFQNLSARNECFLNEKILRHFGIFGRSKMNFSMIFFKKRFREIRALKNCFSFEIDRFLKFERPK